MEPLGELVRIKGSDKLAPILGRLDSGQGPLAGVFSKVLAAKVQGLGEQVKNSGPPPPMADLAPVEDFSRPLEMIREEIRDQGYRPEEVCLPPERKEEVTEFLTGLGLAPEEAREVVEEAADEDGYVNLGRVLDTVAEHRRESLEDGPALPPGLAPQVLVLAEKMGLKEEELNRLSQALGQGEISLRKLANILKLQGSPPNGLKGEDLEGIKELLVKAGLGSEKAEEMINRRLDSQGRLTLPRLANLLQEVVRNEDPALMMTKSGRIEEALTKLLDGARIKPEEPSIRPLAAKTMEHRLNELKAGQSAEEGKGKEQEPALSLSVKDHKSGQERFGEGSRQGAESNLRENYRGKGQAGNQSSGQDKPGSNQAPPLNIPGRAQAGGETPGQPRFEEQVRFDNLNVQIQPGPAKARAGAGVAAGANGQTAEPVRAAAEPGRAEAIRPAGPVSAKAADQVSLASTRSQGPSNAQNQAAVSQAAARSRPSVLLEQLSGRMTLMLKSGQPSMRIQLNPPELGGLKINLRVDGLSVRATIVTETQQVQQLLGSNSSDLRQSLADQGFNLDQFEVLTQGQEGRAKSQGNGGGRNGEGARQEQAQAAEEDGQPAPTSTPTASGRVDLLA